MKRITIVTDAWSPQINGVVVTLDNLVRVLRSRGCEVSIIQPYLFTLRFPLPTYPEIKLALCRPARMRQMLRDSRPDVVHIATEGTLGLAARRACIREGYAFSTAYHTHFPAYLSLRIPGMTGLAYAFLRWFHRAASSVLVPTESIRKDLEAHGFKKLALWPRGVDTSLFRPITCEIANTTRPCFAYFGRIAPEKNVEEFLKLDLPGSKIVVGDGPDRLKLERKYGSSARFLGYKTGEELTSALACVDVVVMPSYTETFGLTIVEALACGIPVAAHDAPGTRDILTSGVDGMLDRDLARAAIACLALSKETCRKTALTYSWESSADAFINQAPDIHV